MKDLSSLGLRHRNGLLEILDQTLLPHSETWLAVSHPDEMVSIIQRLAVRGAPLIGVAAALALAKHAEGGANEAALRVAAASLRASRPTAVNLMYAIDRMTSLGSWTSEALAAEAERIFDEDVQLCEGMAAQGADLIRDGDGVLTHCNTGGLATVGIGTALGVIRRAHEQGKRIHVYVDETRPLLQGARLTAWELGKLDIPYTLICDNMAATVMRAGKIHSAFVGCDRIAANGDIANKIGTYSAAVVAAHHKVPFYVVGPRTTVDLGCATGRDIPIEERGSDEVRAGKSPANANVFNPAFDVTPRELITAIVLDDRVLKTSAPENFPIRLA